MTENNDTAERDATCFACGLPNDRASRFDTCGDCMAAGCPLDYTDPRKCGECDCGKPDHLKEQSNVE